MEAKQRLLSMKDIIKLYLRKFNRLAPAYYLMWLLIWGINSRLGAGEIFFRTNRIIDTCPDEWPYTLLWIANLNVTSMKPFEGCYQ